MKHDHIFYALFSAQQESIPGMSLLVSERDVNILQYFLLIVNYLLWNLEKSEWLR